MEMSGQQRIEAARETVWAALNDPDILKQCIPGCQELTKDSDNSFSAKVRAKVGPVSANFSGQVTLSDIVAPESYRISGEGKGGAAGFAKGGAQVTLSEDGTATLLNYEVEAKVGGKMAQLGARLIDGTARKMAEDFFGRFAELVAPAAEVAPVAAMAGPQPAAVQPSAAVQAESGPEEEERPGLKPLLISGAILAFAVIVYLIMQ